MNGDSIYYRMGSGNGSGSENGSESKVRGNWERRPKVGAGKEKR
jgi:hypothetical protein